jgi:uroporphyrinogen-III synthase/uroporphyrinogen III methyltransferase/synthase
LAGRRVLVTRAAHQAGKLSEGLRALGAEPVEVAVLEIRPPESLAALDAALRQLDSYDWLILTSANAVRALAERAAALEIALTQPVRLKVAAIGEATAAAARLIGLQVDFVPEAYVAESLVEGLLERAAGQRILLARAAVARDVIPDALRAAGADVDVVEAYRNVLPDAAPEQLRQALGKGIDAATFTSSSSATHLAEAARVAGVAWPLAGVPAISIGPITSQTLRELGWPPAAEASPSDIPGLIAAAVRVLAPSGSDDAKAMRTARLRMMPATAETLHLELDDPAAFATLLGVRLPQDWPPGEYDRGAIQFFLEKMIEGGPKAVGWYGWYAILEGSEPAALVGCGGYLGPPDEAGCLEIGYSICEQWRGQGLAKELVQALVDRALALGAKKIVAHTTEANPASIAVLLGCGFQQAIGSESEQLQFEIAAVDSLTG